MISDLIHPYIRSILSDTIGTDDYEVVIPPAGQSGDISIACFPFAKVLGDSPASIAQKLAQGLEQESIVQEVVCVGPFVNISFSDAGLVGMVRDFSLQKHEQKDETIIVDYNQPNIGKPLHIGHLCTPSFGQPAINLLRYYGYTVYGDMHQGDWGGIFGKLIVAWEKWGDEQIFSQTPIDHLLDLYVRINTAIEQEEGVDQECRDAFRLLSQGEEKYVELWKKFTQESLSTVNRVLKPFLIFPDWKVGESFYEGLPLPKLGDWPDLKIPEQTMYFIVDELVDMGIATKNEDGSVGVVFPKETKLPSCILQKRDGTHGYLASDLGTIKYRMQNWDPIQILYFVDNRQALHFRQLFWIAKQAWGIDDSILSHEQNGFVSLPDGAMSTRSGRIIRLEELSKQAHEKTKNILMQRGRQLDQEDISAISIGAIKYTFLMQDRERDWVFDWDRALTFEGNSGPYVQYAIVRTKRLLEQFSDVGDAHSEVCELSEYDKKLVMDLIFFEKQLEKAKKTLKFHALVNFCYEVANHINQFYTNTNRLIDEENRDLQVVRVQLLRNIVLMMETSFEILALPIPTKM